MRLRACLVTLLGGALIAPARAQGPSPGSRELAYHVGPGDVLEVTVEGRPDLSRLPTVQTTGSVHHPLLGDVPVDDLSVAAVGERLSALLAGQGVSAPVQVRVREYNSRSVFVAGEVNRPGRKALRAGGRLLDALVDAGGFSAGASGEVLVQRRDGSFEDGTALRRYRFLATGPTAEDRANLSLVLRPGDLVTARPRQYVLVSGEVARPGRYELDDGMTVSRAIQAAGGLTRYGSPKVSLERARPEDGEPRQIDVDTRAVRSGEAADPALRPDDTLAIKARKL